MPKNNSLRSIRFLFFLFCCCSVSCSADTGLPVPPVQVPAQLDRRGTVAEFDFEVKEHVVYTFDLRFHFPDGDQKERKRVREIIGGRGTDRRGNPTEPGVPTPIRLTVYVKNPGSGEQVYMWNSIPILTSWGGELFSKTIGYCDLKPGYYHVVLESLAEHSEYSTIPTSFGIGSDRFKTSFDPKTADRRRSCPQ